MNNTSNSDSKAKLIVIIADLFIAIVIAFIFILRHQNKPIELEGTMDIDYSDYYDEDTTQQNIPNNFKTTVQDSTHEEADKTSDKVTEADNMNRNTTEGIEITDEIKNYTESTVTEEDNTAEWTEEPKQEEIYVPDNTPQVDNTPSTPEAPVDNTPASSGSDDSFWGSDGGFTDSWNNIDSTEHGSTGWDPAGGWHY